MKVVLHGLDGVQFGIITVEPNPPLPQVVAEVLVILGDLESHPSTS